MADSCMKVGFLFMREFGWAGFSVGVVSGFRVLMGLVKGGVAIFVNELESRYGPQINADERG
jgi:hypothetical protein